MAGAGQNGTNSLTYGRSLAARVSITLFFFAKLQFLHVFLILGSIRKTTDHRCRIAPTWQVQVCRPARKIISLSVVTSPSPDGNGYIMMFNKNKQAGPIGASASTPAGKIPVD